MSLLLLQQNEYFLLLFPTICFVTSGHFLSSIDDRQHDSDRRHQQQRQQQQYHRHLSTSAVVVPAVPRPQRRAVVPRASSPQRPRNSPPPQDHPVPPSALSFVRKIDMLQIDEKLKALRRKRKRLRQLREEVRELSGHLKSKQTFPRFRKSDLLQKMEKTDLRWRKQITARVKAILKRLKRLENEMKIERNFTKTKKKMAKHLPLIMLNMDAAQSSPHILSFTTSKNFKIERLHSSINQSKNGESGASCLGHNDCKPGLCCHRSYAKGVNSSITSVTNVCYHYLLREGELCEDSCQCEARLHCFQSSEQSKGEKSVTKLKRNLYAICKKVSTSDIVDGIYLNSKNSSFHVEPSIYQQ